MYDEVIVVTSPPKSILNGDSRLIEIGCVPGAILHYGSDLKDDQYLRNDLKDKFTTTSVASLAASKMRYVRDFFTGMFHANFCL